MTYGRLAPDFQRFLNFQNVQNKAIYPVSGLLALAVWPPGSGRLPSGWLAAYFQKFLNKPIYAVSGLLALALAGCLLAGWPPIFKVSK